jgi:hypothetical protein
MNYKINEDEFKCDNKDCKNSPDNTYFSSNIPKDFFVNEKLEVICKYCFENERLDETLVCIRCKFFCTNKSMFVIHQNELYCLECGKKIIEKVLI